MTRARKTISHPSSWHFLLFALACMRLITLPFPSQEDAGNHAGLPEAKEGNDAEEDGIFHHAPWTSCMASYRRSISAFRPKKQVHVRMCTETTSLSACMRVLGGTCTWGRSHMISIPWFSCYSAHSWCSIRGLCTHVVYFYAVFQTNQCHDARWSSWLLLFFSRSLPLYACM